jgi:AcrR family transcriptional regulator
MTADEAEVTEGNDPRMTSNVRQITTQARGRKRREALLTAARELLAIKEIDEIAMADVAAYAGIPKSSAYHFYDDLTPLYSELAAVLDGELQASFAEPIGDVRDWEQVIGIIMDRAADFFLANRAAQQLMFGPKTPPEIKRSSRNADIETSGIVERHLDEIFILPQVPDRSRMFFRAIEVADLMFGLSLFEYGELRREMVDEAKKISCAYLALYLPRILFLRGSLDGP